MNNLSNYIIEKLKLNKDIKIIQNHFEGSPEELSKIVIEVCGFDDESTEYKHILNYAAEKGCQYFTFNIPMAQCAHCGHISNTPFSTCPKCGSTNVDLYTRIIGYLTKIKNWSSGRQIEQKLRVYEEPSIQKD